jgi:hypothetical protein
MLEVARLRPGKRRRVKFLARHRPDLLREVVRLFDVPDYYFEPEPIPDYFSEDDAADAAWNDSAVENELAVVFDMDDELPF